jgi:nitrate reductase gamma subunit
VVYVCVGLTFVSLFIALMERLTDPVRRLLSGFDDYFSWAIVVLPLATGMIAIQQSDPLPLAIHLMSVELLFLWLPFGKLAHAFLVFASRGVTGAALARKGAPL